MRSPWAARPRSTVGRRMFGVLVAWGWYAVAVLVALIAISKSRPPY